MGEVFSGDAGQNQAVFLQVEQVKKYLKQRRATQIPLRLQFLYQLARWAGLGERKPLGQPGAPAPAAPEKWDCPASGCEKLGC